MRLSRVVLLIGMSAAGCGSTEKFLRPEPALHVNAGQQLGISLPADLKDTVALRCVGTRSVQYTDSGKPQDQCLYLSVDITGVTQHLDRFKNKDDRNMLTSLLVSVSDQNCQTFLARAFANKAGLDTTTNVLGDLATGTAAGTAVAHPAVSAALSVSTLLAGKTSGNFDKTYYAEKTFQAMESTILGERASAKDQIIKNMAKDTSVYTVFDTINEVRQYDETCSIQRGLLKLAELADQKKAASEDQLKKTLAAQ